MAGATNPAGSGRPKPASPLAITGATGRLGGRIARRLAAAGTAQRFVVRDPRRAAGLPDGEVLTAAYHDGEAVRRALAGTEVVLMVSGAEAADRVKQHYTFVDAAAAAGVRHLVYTSFFGAAPDATFSLVRDHWATEEHIRRSGLAYTFLRDNLYLDFLPLMVGDDGVIRGPAGDGRFAGVAQDDIADVAAAILLTPEEHASQTYDLTGPESLTMQQAAEILTRATGHQVRYHAETVEEAYASRAGFGAPGWQVDAWVSTYTAIANGELDGVTGHVERLAGHPATSLSDLLRRGL